MNGEDFSAEKIMRQVFSRESALAERSSATCRNPYRLIEPIRALRKELKLTTNDLVVLQSLISFIPSKQDKAALTVVFPSNATLSERANGLSERTIRRSIIRLVDAGLVARKDSATGKRFPLRYGGQIKDAFGIDLRPMFDREGDLLRSAELIERQKEELRSLRAKALALRVEALRMTNDAETISFLSNIRNILRRASLKVGDIIDIIQKLGAMTGVSPDKFPAGNRLEMNEGTEATRHAGQQQGEANDNPCAEFPARNPSSHTVKTGHLSADDGQIVRHVKQQTLNIKKKSEGDLKPNPLTMSWKDLKTLSTFFPEEPKSTQTVISLLLEIGKMLRIHQSKILELLKNYGPGRLFIALDDLMMRTSKGKVRNPNSYLDAMML